MGTQKDRRQGSRTQKAFSSLRQPRWYGVTTPPPASLLGPLHFRQRATPFRAHWFTQTQSHHFGPPWIPQVSWGLGKPVMKLHSYQGEWSHSVTKRCHCAISAQSMWDVGVRTVTRAGCIQLPQREVVTRRLLYKADMWTTHFEGVGEGRELETVSR